MTLLGKSRIYYLQCVSIYTYEYVYTLHVLHLLYVYCLYILYIYIYVIINALYRRCCDVCLCVVYAGKRNREGGELYIENQKNYSY